MAVRTDVSIEWEVSPRVVTVAAPSTEITIQDLHDTLASFEDSETGGQHPGLVTSAGKEPIGSGTLVGITTTMQDVRLAFEARKIPVETGTATSADATGTLLTDTAATYIANAVEVGAAVINKQTGAVGTVLEIISETELRHSLLDGGTNQQWGLGDDYNIHNVAQCNVSGGNLVAIDSNGNEIDPIYPTAFTQVVRTASASATLQEQVALQFASYEGAATVEIGSPHSGTEYPVGTSREPVNNIMDAVQITQDVGLQELKLIGNATFGSGDNVDGLTIRGSNPVRTTLNILPAASTVGTEIENCTLTGTLDGNSLVRNCYVLDLDYVEGSLVDCLIGPGTITLAGSVNSHILGCRSAVPGSNTPVVDMGGSGHGLGVRDYSGGIKLINKTGPEAVTVELTAGKCVLDSTVTDGYITVRGVGVCIDNSGGTAIVDTTKLVNPENVADAVWSKSIASLTDPNTIGGYIVTKVLTFVKYLSNK